jgi:DNA-binding response OmpR family regulator
MTIKLLVIDDDTAVTDLLSLLLKSQGFEVFATNNSSDGLSMIREMQPDLVILDLMMPEMDGWEVCRSVRQFSQIPIIILSALNDPSMIASVLDAGADDYLTKPFNPRELVARVKAILRRGERSTKMDDLAPIYLGDLMIDPSRREVHLPAKSLDLRTQEFDLLLTLAEHRGRVLSREQILQKAWGFDFYGQTRTVDVHVAHLRKKLEESSVKIETVTGVGYKLVVSS